MKRGPLIFRGNSALRKLSERRYIEAAEIIGIAGRPECFRGSRGLRTPG